MPGPPVDLPPDLNALFGDLFGQLFSGNFAANLSVDLALTDAEAASGVTREITLKRPRACTDCAGRGSKKPGIEPKACAACNATGRREVTQGFFKVQTTCAACKGAGKTITDPCTTCIGTGRVLQEATVSVVVPPNTEHGTHLKLDGEGGIGDDGAFGILYVYVLVGDRADPRAEALTAAEASRAAVELGLPQALVHRPPMPTWQVAAIAIVVLGMLAAMLLAR